MTEMSETDIARKYPGMNVLLSENYRLVSDPLQFIVLRRHTIDPTAAPNWATRVAEAEAAGAPTPDPTPRSDWREAGYFSLTPEGLRTAIDFAIMQKVRQQEASTVTDLFEFIRAENGVVFQAVSRQIL